jgi:small subunit ribosomal protein S20
VANIKSQIKRNRQNEKRRVRNRVSRGEARTAIKNAHVAIEAGDAEQSKAAVQLAIRDLDRAVQQGVLHKNNVARRKSRLMKNLAKMEVKVKVEPVAEAAPAAVEEPKAKRTTKAAAATKAAAKEAPKKAAAKKPAEKKPAAKKPAEKKPAAKKTSAKEE